MARLRRLKRRAELAGGEVVEGAEAGGEFGYFLGGCNLRRRILAGGRALIPKKRRWGGCILLTVFELKKEIPA